MRAARFALVRAPAAARLRRPPLARTAAARWSSNKTDGEAAARDGGGPARRAAKADQRDAKADAINAKRDARAAQAAREEAMGREHAEKLANAWDLSLIHI